MNNSYYFESSLPVFFPLFIIVILRCLLFNFLRRCIDVIYVYDSSTAYLNMERYVKRSNEYHRKIGYDVSHRLQLINRSFATRVSQLRILAFLSYWYRKKRLQMHF